MSLSGGDQSLNTELFCTWSLISLYEGYPCSICITSLPPPPQGHIMLKVLVVTATTNISLPFI